MAHVNLVIYWGAYVCFFFFPIQFYRTDLEAHKQTERLKSVELGFSNWNMHAHCMNIC